MPWRVLGDPVETRADAEREAVVVERARRRMAYVPRLWLPDWQPRQGLARILGPALDEFARRGKAGEQPMWLLSSPPRHGKTELCGKAIAARFLWDNPGRSVLYATSTDPRAVDVSRSVRRTCEALAGAVEDAAHLGRRPGGAWTSNAWDTAGGGTFTAVGAGVATGGLNAGLRVFDDVTGSAERYRSAAERHRTQRWLVEDILSRSDGRPWTLGMETRRGVLDLRAWLESEMPGVWTVVDVPRLVDETTRHLLSEWDPRQLGEYLWPERHGEEERRSAGLSEDVVATSTVARAVWLALHQQIPMPEGGTAWQRSWLSHHYAETPAQMAARCALRWLSIDTASTGGGGNYSVIWHLGWQGDDLRILGAWRGQWSYPDLRTTVRQVYDSVRPHSWLVEDTSNGRPVADELASVLPGCVRVRPVGSKRDRMDACSAMLESGRVQFPSTSEPWVLPTIDRLAALTGHGDETDDDADVLTQAIIHRRQSSAGVVRFTGISGLA